MTFIFFVLGVAAGVAFCALFIIPTVRIISRVLRSSLQSHLPELATSNIIQLASVLACAVLLLVFWDATGLVESHEFFIGALIGLFGCGIDAINRYVPKR